MVTVTWQELRDRTGAILARVEAGDSIVITVDGRRVASLEPVDHRRRMVSSSWFVRRILSAQADAALRTELRLLAPDTTDDLTSPPD